MIVAVQRYGKKWKLIQKEVPSRTAPQIRAHAQKFFIKLSRFKPEETDVITYIKKTSATSLLNIASQDNPNEFDGSLSDVLSSSIPIRSEASNIEQQ